MRNRLMRLVMTNAACGAAAGGLLAGGLVAFDAHGLGRLVFADPEGLIGLALLTAGFMSLIGSFAAGAAVMMLPVEGGPRDGSAPVPVPVRLRRR